MAKIRNYPYLCKKNKKIMTYTHKLWALMTFFIILSTALHAQEPTTSPTQFQEASFLPDLWDTAHPLRETRAVWLTTIGGLDWPRTKATDARSQELQKRELTQILDSYKKANINTVLLQTRVRASVIYPSAIEPWEQSLTGRAGKAPGYDPLAFCIEECHKRGMELHAWIVCIPIGTTQRQRSYGAASIIRKRKELVKTAKGGEMFMIPGKPETANYIASICKEIVENYDVDGISLDYIRYPEATYRFSDDNLYSKSSGMSKAEWRRDNITRIVKRVHDTVKPIKPWVKLSSSPIGKYNDTNRYSSGGWNCYDAVWQDPQMWLRENYQDLLFPMMYFTGDNFYPFLYDWKENSYGHPVVPGLGIYFLDPKEGRWTLNDVRAQMHTARNSGIGGIAFYRGEFLTGNYKGIYTTACDEFFPYPALTPRMTWTDNTQPPTVPTNLKYTNGKLTWNASLPQKAAPALAGEYILYNIYGSNTYPVDVNDPQNLLATNIRDTQYELKGRYTKVLHHAVTAIDRYGNESSAAQEAKPSVSLPRNINVPQLINRDKANEDEKGKKKRKKK